MNLFILLDDLYTKYQPDQAFQFPSREFGASKKRKRSAQASCFRQYQWLHYRIEDDRVFCDTCISAIRQSKLENNIELI